MFVILLYSIAGGMLAVLSTSRIEQIAWKFLRLIGILALALAAGPTVWLLREDGLTWLAGFGTAAVLASAWLVFLAPFAAQTRTAFRALCALGGLAGLTAACGAAVGPQTRIVTGLLTVAAQVLSGLMLGSITLAWLLGHAYLTATSMTIAPLRHFSRTLSWTVAFRIVFVIGSLAVAWAVSEAPVLARLYDAWLIALLRIGVGLLAVAVFAFLVSDCVRLRATQSATGILYFGSLMAYVGELAGQQLTREIGWPL